MSRKKELSGEEREAIGTQTEVIAQLLVRLGRAYVRAVRVEQGQNDPAERKFAEALTEGFVWLVESGLFNNKS